ncbi:MAG: Diphthamide biosynthesis protein 2 [Trizodia sp. TS-e1964]|nr:MAG: Diphthamide biosynthesis protein 2 [Trizodia sp. TS-e1964]
MGSLSQAPVLSTPDTHIFEDPTPPWEHYRAARTPDDELLTKYEIADTVRQIKQGNWTKIALQFPDELLVDAPRVFGILNQGLAPCTSLHAHGASASHSEDSEHVLADNVNSLKLDEPYTKPSRIPKEKKLYVLADTSYGSCCVDEVAAEHVDADVVVHYGKACLSPTARLPVIYIFTNRKLKVDHIIQSFKENFPNTSENVILMADTSYSSHVPRIYDILRAEGYINLFKPTIIHDPSSLLPNRTLPDAVTDGIQDIASYHLFHISEPPASLLLILSSRLASIYIYPIPLTSDPPSKAYLATTASRLRRRYALVLTVATEPTIGILINTLSVKNYLEIVDQVKAQILAAGKKSYTFVVGKVNAAKVANFSEIGGWVVIGCWESSLIESKDFYRPIITPFELALALQPDSVRVWTGEWKTDFNEVLSKGQGQAAETAKGLLKEEIYLDNISRSDGINPNFEHESAAPDFDLRTGRYVSNSRPLFAGFTPRTDGLTQNNSSSLIHQYAGSLAKIGGQVSTGAEFLNSSRTWKGLGSDFRISYDDPDEINGAPIEEGRSGIARGYNVSGRGVKR